MAENDDRTLGTPGRRALTLAAGALLVLLPLGAATADELTSRQARRLATQAEKELDRGNLKAVREAYQQIVDGSGISEPLRADALWYLALDAMAGGGSDGIASARAYLDTLLAEHTAYPRLGQAKALVALFGQLSEARGESARLARRLGEREREIAAASAELAEQEGDDQAKSTLESAVADLRRQLAEARRSLATREEELKKKEEALQKLKDALVGGGG